MSATRRLCLTYIYPPETDRWMPGDRWWRPLVRRVVRGPKRPGGLDKVYINLRLGLDRLRLPYEVNVPFDRLRPDDLVGVLGRGRQSLNGYKRRERLVAGIGLMTHPSEWPTLFEEYPVACYLQHSTWAADVYRRQFGDEACAEWAVGIDTVAWAPKTRPQDKPIDFLIYDKLRWNRPSGTTQLLDPIRAALESSGKSSMTLRYGEYTPAEYETALQRCRAAIFVSSHESQGIACQEAMAAGVPVFAWDPGRCLDPARFAWGEPNLPATSVPFFDSRCGDRFKDAGDFRRKLPAFLDALAAGRYAPRDYILENLTVEKCAQRFVDLLREKLGG